MLDKLDCGLDFRVLGDEKFISDQIQKNRQTCHIAKVVSSWAEARLN